MDVFFFNDTATTEIYTLSLHDALPISGGVDAVRRRDPQSLLDLGQQVGQRGVDLPVHPRLDVEQEIGDPRCLVRSEEHTSELQSRQYLVCRLLLEKKKNYLGLNIPCIS